MQKVTQNSKHAFLQGFIYAKQGLLKGSTLLQTLHGTVYPYIWPKKNYDLPLQSRKHAHSSHCYYSKTRKCVAIHNKPHARAFAI